MAKMHACKVCYRNEWHLLTSHHLLTICSLWY